MSQPITFDITGMTCDHCALSVRKALNRIPGVNATVSWPEAKARIEADPAITREQLIAAIESAGYGVGEGKHSLSVVILGSGSAAFAAAIRLDAEGAQVTMVEQGTLGGTCVNIGCVPSKIFIRQAETVHKISHPPFPAIRTNPARIDFAALRAQQQSRVEELRQAKYTHILDLHPAIRFFSGRGAFVDDHTIRVTGDSGAITDITADKILIATGVRPEAPPIPGLSETPFWISTEALMTTRQPEHLIIIGGGFISCEIGQAFSRLGSRVTLIQRGERLLSSFDPDLGQGLETLFREETIRVLTKTRVLSVSHDGRHFTVTTDGGTLSGDALMVATGRRPNTDSLNLAACGVKTDDQGHLPVNGFLQTNIPHIYAAGDVTPLPAFVYVAAKSGTAAAGHMLTGEGNPLDLSLVPEVVFTDPPVATVGLTEAEARSRGMDVDVRTLTLDHVPRSLANFDTRGFVKLVADKQSGRLVGAHLLADQAGEMIQVAHLAIAFGMTPQELGDRLFPYLTMSEGLKLAAQTFKRDVSTLSCCAG